MLLAVDDGTYLVPAPTQVFEDPVHNGILRLASYDWWRNACIYTLACVNNEGEGLGSNLYASNITEILVGSSDRGRKLGQLCLVCEMRDTRLVSSNSLLPVGRGLDAREWKGHDGSFAIVSGCSKSGSKESDKDSDSQGNTSHCIGYWSLGDCISLILVLWYLYALDLDCVLIPLACPLL